VCVFTSTDPASAKEFGPTLVTGGHLPPRKGWDTPPIVRSTGGMACGDARFSHRSTKQLIFIPKTLGFAIETHLR
jgi:hypothetical protein